MYQWCSFQNKGGFFVFLKIALFCEEFVDLLSEGLNSRLISELKF